MMSSQTQSTVLFADQEHAGLRTAVFILLFTMLGLAFFGIRALLGALSANGLPDYTFAISCGGAFPVALAIVWVAERVMKRYWSSGRSVTLTSDGIQVQADDEAPVQLSQSSDVIPLFWHFDLRGWQRGGRERRVPRNWLCLAVELKAGKKRTVIYTYASKQKAQTWLAADSNKIQFHEISPREVYDNSIRSRLSGPSRPEIPTAVLSGKDGRYWLAERRRWTEGFELPPKEFEAFMHHVQRILLKEKNNHE